jgi:hypothetical protein
MSGEWEMREDPEGLVFDKYSFGLEDEKVLEVGGGGGGGRSGGRSGSV